MIPLAYVDVADREWYSMNGWYSMVNRYDDILRRYLRCEDDIWYTITLIMRIMPRITGDQRRKYGYKH